MKKKVLIFDFDGTIADTMVFVVKTFNELSEKYGYEKIGKEDIYKLRNKGAKEIFTAIKIPLWKLPLISSNVKSELAEKAKNFKPIKGIDNVLKILKKKGYFLGILTSNSEKSVRIFLDKYKIDFIGFVYSKSSIFGKDKVIKRLLKDRHLKNSEVLYFGDEVIPSPFKQLFTYCYFERNEVKSRNLL